MATVIDRSLAPPIGNERFFLGAAIAMTIVIVSGFSHQLAMGRSTFYSPPLVHAHAIMFMGWVAIYPPHVRAPGGQQIPVLPIDLQGRIGALMKAAQVFAN